MGLENVIMMEGKRRTARLAQIEKYKREIREKIRYGPEGEYIFP